MEIKLQHLIILLFLSGTVGYLLNPDDSAQEFILAANELYGEPSWNKGTWTVVQLSEYTSYSYDMWDTHPIIITGLFGDNVVYTCFSIGD